MISSRKIENVEAAIKTLREEDNVTVEGMVCHVGKDEDRKNLIKEVRTNFTIISTVLNVLVNVY